MELRLPEGARNTPHSLIRQPIAFAKLPGIFKRPQSPSFAISLIFTTPETTDQVGKCMKNVALITVSADCPPLSATHLRSRFRKFVLLSIERNELFHRPGCLQKNSDLKSFHFFPFRRFFLIYVIWTYKKTYSMLSPISELSASSFDIHKHVNVIHSCDCCFNFTFIYWKVSNFILSRQPFLIILINRLYFSFFHHMY